MVFLNFISNELVFKIWVFYRICIWRFWIQTHKSSNIYWKSKPSSYKWVFIS